MKPKRTESAQTLVPVRDSSRNALITAQHVRSVQHPPPARLQGTHRGVRAAMAIPSWALLLQMAAVSWDKVLCLPLHLPGAVPPPLSQGEWIFISLGCDSVRLLQSSCSSPSRHSGERQGPSCPRVCGMAVLLPPCQAFWAAQGAFGNNWWFSMGATR